MNNVEVLKKLGNIKRLCKGDYLFKQGDPGSEMYILLSGKIDVMVGSGSGPFEKIAELGPGGFIGEMSILEDMPRSASAFAAEDTIVLSIGKNNFMDFISNQPEIAYKIMKGLSARIRRLNEELLHLRPPASGNPDHDEYKAGSDTAESASDNTELSDILFPEGHKKYGKKVPEEYEAYLFNKPAKCPVCGHGFNALMPRMSKLKLDRIDNDFRKHHVDFDTLWYNIWVCPKCYYSSFNYDFNNPISPRLAKAVQEKLEELKNTTTIEFKDPLTIDQVFTSYYLALYCAKAANANPLKIGKLWLQLSWLYRDLKDERMAKTAALNALEYYHDAFYNSKLDISPEEEQQCCIVLAELYIIKGDLKEAAAHFHKAIKRGSGSAVLNQQARDRIQDLKTMLASSDE